jgi:hypothetical protein
LVAFDENTACDCAPAVRDSSAIRILEGALRL